MSKIRKIAILVLAVAAVVSFLIQRENLTQKAVTGGTVTVVEAPEQTEAMEHEAFLAEEYVSVLPEGENLALEGKIESSSFQDSYTPRKAIDGKADGVSYWEGAKDSYPNYLTVNLKEEKSFHAIRVCLNPDTRWGNRTQEFSVEISSDGENFTELIPSAAYEFTPDRNNEVILEFDETAAQYVQLKFTSNTGAGGGQVAEFEIYG
ncbi:MAG: discoidin domain-containing protein [Eubacteriales bacterium]|nr:discoidin domain-containing protein [Eubacteriales bacterium]